MSGVVVVVGATCCCWRALQEEVAEVVVCGKVDARSAWKFIPKAFHDFHSLIQPPLVLAGWRRGGGFVHQVASSVKYRVASNATRSNKELLRASEDFFSSSSY